MTGFVKYNVDYTALMFRPFKNEVLDAVVKSVSEVCSSRPLP
jgi:DNA-directed RNA polymerase subunit E'/Rpb7